jgi:hypothetical protein
MRFTFAILLAGMLGGVSHAQQIVSAHAGVVHYTEGRVYVGNQLVEKKFGVFPDLQVGQELRTEDGRAEVLLTPGAFLRLSQNSSVQMLSRDLSDTRFEVLTGSVMVECDELAKDASLTVVYKGDKIQLEKHGLYRLDATESRFRVYDGRAIVVSGSDQLALKRGNETSLNGVLVAQSFKPNPKLGDDFYAWNGMRSGYLASANVSAAQSVYNGGTHWRSSAWMWDPWYGSFTFIPAGGVLFNPFGWGFYSPGMVIYAPTPVYGGYVPTGGRPIAGGTGNSGSRTGAPAAGSRPGGFGGGASGGGAPRGGAGAGGFGGGSSRGVSSGGVGGGSVGASGGGASAGGGHTSGGGFGGGAHGR